ncbi:MAG TPA: hypothetical protein VMH88_13220 [Gemmatimonadales bacterium]|nr:hypothetical protein [Gemmatimonadales bacterium]
MFSRGTSTLTQRALAAAGLIRSFLLLEDDDPVDWEVDVRENAGDAQATGAALHARKLKRPNRARRPGSVRPAFQLCLSPVGADATHERLRARGAERTGHRGRPSCRRPSPR